MQNQMLEHPRNTTGAPLQADTTGFIDWITQAIVPAVTEFIAPLVGALIGFTIAFTLNVAVRLLGRRSRLMKAMLKRSTSSFTSMLTAWGAWLALVITHLWSKVSDVESSDIAEVATEAAHISPLEHILLILAIGASTWFAYTSIFLLEDAANIRAEVNGVGSRRFETQAQVLRRLGQVIIIFIGIAFIIFTFPAARQVMAGLLASAGIVSVIAGLAAQSTLGNVFAGLQLAFTDAIRVGDTVVAGPKGESGQIEEITLSYVVVRVWDERRLVIPSSQFTTSTFENWTRRAPKQQGTIELRLDWAAPMTQIRQKVASILAATDLWDGRAWDVHITDADKDTILVRILVSARNSSDLFQLRALIREEMIHWIMTEEPWVRPTFLIQQRQTIEVPHDPTGEEIARLAYELSNIAADPTIPQTTPETPNDNDTTTQIPQQFHAADLGQMTPEQAATHAARIKASRQKAKKARRRAIAERAREMAEGAKIAGEHDGNADLLATQILTTTIRKTPPTPQNQGE